MVSTGDSQSPDPSSILGVPTKDFMKLEKDGDGIHVAIKTKEQVELCDYILVNGIRFVKVHEVQRKYRLKVNEPSYNGHERGCNCFICNH